MTADDLLQLRQHLAAEPPMTSDDLDRIMRRHPHLSAHGIITPERHAAESKCEVGEARREIAEWRNDLQSSLTSCVAASEWIKVMSSTNSPANAICSYTLKHVAEEDRSTYISNGAMIAAAIYHDFPITVDEWQSPNVGICISRLSLRRNSAEWRRQTGLPSPPAMVEIQVCHRIVGGRVEYDTRPCTIQEAESIAGCSLNGQRRYLIIDGVVGCFVETAWLCPACDGAAKSGISDCERCLCSDANVKQLWQPITKEGRFNSRRRVMCRPGQIPFDAVLQPVA